MLKTSLSLLLVFFFFEPAFAQTSACVKSKEAVLRSSMEKKGIEVGKATQYTPFSLTGKTKRNWLEAKDLNGRKVWIRRGDVSYTLSCISVRVNKTRLYKRPTKKSEKGKLARRGDSFLDLGGEDGWLQVQTKAGDIRWINLDHIWRPTAKMRMSFERD
ncbi:MAG: hypothetical protein COT73_08405 [Bdellovibrio sp. CG10_big_fil_rev_8_21_14_0_10_47_8]|nr:MAG: hypothetical protein COT73_08405 [Bdellovibrio sp. CG10_big_fil_rev_8_21_14_0_10_47_8]